MNGEFDAMPRRSWRPRSTAAPNRSAAARAGPTGRRRCCDRRELPDDPRRQRRRPRRASPSSRGRPSCCGRRSPRAGRPRRRSTSAPHAIPMPHIDADQRRCATRPTWCSRSAPASARPIGGASRRTGGAPRRAAADPGRHRRARSSASTSRSIWRCVGRRAAFPTALARRARRTRRRDRAGRAGERLAELRRDSERRAASLDACPRPRVGRRCTPPTCPRVCQEVFDDDAVLVIDGGNTAVWANLYHEIRVPDTHARRTSSSGCSAPASARRSAPQVAFPERQVYCIIGDGAMGFHPQEIETAVRNDLPVIYLVLCDRQWGMVKINQSPSRWTRAAMIAEAHAPAGGARSTPTSARSVGTAWPRAWARTASACRDAGGAARPRSKRCLASGRCAVVHVDVDPVEHTVGARPRHVQGHAPGAGG